LDGHYGQRSERGGEEDLLTGGFHICVLQRL
jgi:hypothetical protein